MTYNTSLYKGLVILLLVMVGILTVLPSLQLFITSLSDISDGGQSSLWRMLSQSSTWKALWHSFYTSSLAMLLSLLIGGTLAFLIALTNIGYKSLWAFLFMLPMMIPPQVMALCWIQLFGPSSTILKSLGMAPALGSSNPIYSAEGIAFLLGIQHAPLVFLALRTQLIALPKEQIEAARLCGASNRHLMSDIILPLCYPALLAAAALAFVSALGNFGIAAMIGIPISYLVLPTLIYQQMANFGTSVLNDVASLSILMAILAYLIVYLQNKAQQASSLHLIGGSGQTLFIPLGQYRKAAELALALLLFIILILPLLALIFSSLIPTMGVPLNWQTLTFEAYATVFSKQSATYTALINSLLLSVSAAVTLMGICVVLAYLATRYAGKKSQLLISMIDIPFTLPGIVLAIACILLFARPLPWLGWSLYGSLAIIFIAYLARFMAVCFKPVFTQMKQIDPSMEEAAQLSGASLLVRLKDIIFPLLTPSAFAGALLVFLTAVNELTVSALLWSAGTETLGVVIFNLDESGNKVLASAVSVLVVFLVAIVMWLLNSLSRFLPKGVIPWQS
ncbi:iron ABC transporter permease [Vibrio sp. HA2012]|uniref:ABC transporter permease n=1 Tax=Vibrio sp. HA2012 TaxID=1971595 RepID=UPI000C2B8F94|nr:iron ABC transporter permease [Vibrio sp. HA2012]PJC87025.1 iron ABC transporter permease [Vibrio sp. HA2012]